MIRRCPRPMRAGTAILGLAILMAGCASSEITPEERRLLQQPDLPPEQRREILARTTGTISGTVREASTRQPLEGVIVHTEYLGDRSKADGRFRIAHLDPGEVTLVTWRRDLIETSQRTRARAGRETTVDLFVEHAPPACCRLAGTWSARLVLGEPGQLATPRGTQVTGLVTFDPDIPNPFPPAMRGPADDRTLDEFGTYDIDLLPMLGQNLPRPAQSTIASDPDILTEVWGYVHNRNEVSMTLIPQISHGGLSLRGSIEGDEVRGTWTPRGFGTTTGTFVMLRQKRE